ncbi:hypothetical protein [Krasilnikoviella flava]|uniref:Uncharacterized protein n=1 Tax=Krasilnikoviella flava TaxID=526729 RepID=A0A1T5JDU6_9MICO|nr:hypothetical protein [Krasilnikoviella flava]SKC49747.1 hypothetical protein SAMN04324258_1299 [Krasilnikoviella flava]
MSPRARTSALLLAGTLLVASGCTGGGTEEAGGAAAAAGPEAEAAADPGTASVADQVMAEQSIATPHGSDAALGGEVTVSLRAVEVADGTTTVRWALRWDDDASPADAGASWYDMSLEPVTTVTDRAGLKAYRPFCTEGAWQEDTDDSTKAAVAQMKCRDSMLVSPLEKHAFKFPNHGTIEVSAVLPAPEGEPATVDVLPAEGLPLFTDATVTYADGAAK